MEENMEVVKHRFVVPYNNSSMLKAMKKQKITYGILTLICAAFFAILAGFAATSKNSSIGVVIVFMAFVVGCVGCSLFFFLTNKPNPKNENKSLTYEFYNDFLFVNQDDENKQTHKNLTKCLYRKYQNKQYVSKVIESGELFEIKIFTGTYNGIPQYKKHFVPKDVIKSEEMETFKQFLKQILKHDYVVKK